MPELIEELRRLACLWDQHAAALKITDLDQLGRTAGYASGLSLCARQVTETLERYIDES